MTTFKLVSDLFLANNGTQWLTSLAYQAANRLTDVWGEDAREFRPERWEEPNFPHKKMPGVWGELATFGGGPHNCM